MPADMTFCIRCWFSGIQEDKKKKTRLEPISCWPPAEIINISSDWDQIIKKNLF